MNQLTNHHPASFRDPSGFIYEQDGLVYRFVSTLYQTDYDLLIGSGLADSLVKQKLLLPFIELNENHTHRNDWYKTLQPKQIPFFTYAWEWSFDQLKDAALTTLAVCKNSLQKGMILKDATHTNTQFVDGSAKLIDTLSFEKYEEGEQWVAYRQFCECFLNPLLIATHRGMEVHKLMLAYPDGVPVGLTAQLLPYKTKFNPSVYLHVHLHAKIAGKSVKEGKTKRKVTQKNIEQILQSLLDLIQSLKLPVKKTVWNNYYDETILSESYLTEKKRTVSSLLSTLNYTSVIDLGANEGEFSLLCNREALVVSADFDSDCIDSFYRLIKEQKLKNIVPVVVDLTYPTPGMGWMNKERPALFSRKKFDVCLALALVHHLAIAKNISFAQLAEFFAEICDELIIEFVPKTDPKIEEMLKWREDVFSDYNENELEKAFSPLYSLAQKLPVTGSQRVLYYFQKN